MSEGMFHEGALHPSIKAPGPCPVLAVRGQELAMGSKSTGTPRRAVAIRPSCPHTLCLSPYLTLRIWVLYTPLSP